MFNSLILSVNEHIINPLIFLLIAVAGMVFMWGLLRYIGASDNVEEKARGQRHMIYGIIGMAIMLSALGIVTFIAGSIGVPVPAI